MLLKPKRPGADAICRGIVADASLWNIPPVFSWLQREGVLSEEEMSRTFNCGLGAVLVVGQLEAPQVLSQIQAQEQAWIVGSVTRRHPGANTLSRTAHFKLHLAWSPQKAYYN